MHNDCEEITLKLQCKNCDTQFYWGSIYTDVSSGTTCPKCSTASDDFIVLQKIINGSLAE